MHHQQVWSYQTTCAEFLTYLSLFLFPFLFLLVSKSMKSWNQVYPAADEWPKISSFRRQIKLALMQKQLNGKLRRWRKVCGSVRKQNKKFIIEYFCLKAVEHRAADFLENLKNKRTRVVRFFSSMRGPRISCLSTFLARVCVACCRRRRYVVADVDVVTPQNSSPPETLLQSVGLVPSQC